MWSFGLYTTIHIYPLESNCKSNRDYLPFDREKGRHHYHVPWQKSTPVRGERIVSYMILSTRTQASKNRSRSNKEGT